MRRYDHLKEKALKLRKTGLSLQEICSNLGLSKGTVYYWIKEIPLQRKSRSGENFRRQPHGAGSRSAISAKARHDAACYESKQQAPVLMQQREFRDFIVMYHAEGTRKGRNEVGIANSNPAIILMAARWIGRLSGRQPSFCLQYYVDHDPKKLKQWWAEKLGVNADSISAYPKTNSGSLIKRNHRSENGVMKVRVGDTYLKSKIDVWMSIVEQEWREPDGV